MREIIQIEVEYTAEDFATTARYILRKRRLFQRAIGPILTVGIIVFLGSFLVNPLKAFGGLLRPRMVAILLLVTVAIFAVYVMRRRKYGFLTKRNYVKAIKADKFLSGTRIIRFAPTGIQGDHALGSGEVYWPAFVKIEETEDYFYFFVTEGSAQIVPKRVFCDEDLARLRSLLRENIPEEVELELMV